MSTTAPDPCISEYNPVVATTQFAAGFPVFDNDDLVVIHNGVERDDFAVSATYDEGISTDAKAVFATGITGNVLVVGKRDPRRKNRFAVGGPLPIRDFNLALDTLTAEVQEARRDVGRALKSDYGDDPGNIAPEAGKVLGWLDNKLRNIDPATLFNLAGGVQPSDIPVFNYPHLLAMGNVYVLPIFDRIRTSGYYAPGDGGGALYERVLTEPSRPGKFQSLGGQWWQLVAEGPVDIRVFGAVVNANIFPALADAIAWATTTPTLSNGRAIKVSGAYLAGAPNSGDAGIFTMLCFGVKLILEADAVIKRPAGAWSTIALQGDDNAIIGGLFDWGWSTTTTETWPSLGKRRPAIYLSGNYNRIDTEFRNLPGNAIQLDGMQRFGIRQEIYDGNGKLVYYGIEGVCARNNDLSGTRVLNAFFGGITQYWATGTKMIDVRIDTVGCECVTFDTYTSDATLSLSLLENAVVPGRQGGVGAIGMDSAFRCKVTDNTIDTVSYIGGYTAGIHLLGDENDTRENIITGNHIKNCGGVGIKLTSGASAVSLALASGSVTSPKRNHIRDNTIISCGGDAAFRAYLATVYATPPALFAILIDYNPGNPAQNNYLGFNNTYGHAVVDAPNGGWTSNPANPNATYREALQ